MNADEKLAAIAALCDRADDCDDLSVLTEDLRAILDVPSVGAAQPHDTTRDALKDIVNEAFEYAGYEAGGDTLNEYADRILAVVNRDR